MIGCWLSKDEELAWKALGPREQVRRLEAMNPNVNALDQAKPGTWIEAPHESYFSPRSIGDIVYLKCGDDTRGVINGIHVRPGGIGYSVTWADTRQSTDHWSLELVDSPEL